MTTSSAPGMGRSPIILSESTGLWFDGAAHLTEEEKSLRDLARRKGMDVVEVEKIAKDFHSFDTDRSGEIEKDEFKDLVMHTMKVRDQYDLPDRRLEEFWRNVDTDGSGTISLEEFVTFMRDFFGRGKTHVLSPRERMDRNQDWNKSKAAEEERNRTSPVGTQKNRLGGPKKNNLGVPSTTVIGMPAMQTTNMEDRIADIARWHESK